MGFAELSSEAPSKGDAVIGFFGSLGNTGTINVYAVANSGGSSPRLLASQTTGSGTGGVAIEVKSGALGTFINTGTTYSYLAVAGTVDSGGTWWGALGIISHQSRTAPTTVGLFTVGSRYV